MRRAMAALTSLSRRASWMSAVVIGVWVAWSGQPLTVPRLLVRTQALEYAYAEIYSDLHERPFAFCDSYPVQREEALSKVRQRAKALTGGLGDVVTIVREYDATLRQHYEEDCRSGWRPYQNPANLQKVFTQDYPAYFVISVLNLTEIRLALLQLIAGWLGVVALALLSVFFWRSSLAPVAGLAATSVLLRTALNGAMAVAVPGVPWLATMDQHFVFPAVTVLLIIAMVQPALTRSGGPGPIWLACLALAYALHASLYYVVDPPVARMFTLVGLGYVAAVGLAFRRWRVIGVAVAAGAVQFAIDGWFRAPGLEIYAVVTRTNHLASDAYNNVMIYMGLFERPTPFGLFYMDEIFGWILDQDPVLVRLDPLLAAHQSFALTGRTMVWHAITSEPLTVIDAVLRRVLLQIFHRPLWIFWTLKIDWVYTWTLLAMFGVNLWAWIRKPLFVALTPITLCLLVNQFAVNTVMTLIHTHSRWNLLGVMLMFATAPLYLFAGLTLLASVARRSWDWLRGATTWVPTWRPVPLIGAVLLLAAFGWFARFSLTRLEQEREFAHVWMTVHQPPPGGLDILNVVREIESTRDQASHRNGATAMWTASILRMYLGRHPELPVDEAKQLDQLRQMYYRQALRLAPGNPHFLFLAQFLEIKDWESFLLEGLRRFPNSVYAPGAVAALHYYGKDFPPWTQESIARQYETVAGRFLSSAPSRVPGFEAVPSLAHTLAGTAKAEQVTRAGGSSALVVTLGPRAVVSLADKPTYGSTAVRLLSYVDLQNGDVEAGLALAGHGGEPRIAHSRFITSTSQIAASRYQLFEAPVAGETSFGMWLKAGERGATVEVRHYYPVVDDPQRYYRSGLMERVRRREARSNPARPGSF
jgi:hypothetical protein